ncbi:MAG: selenocysteine-specific translation elongation factor [Acidobacteria bacterium]|nr:selenocysteine-specific translation elongation factor [Acidobacteriota bacterium]
MKSIIVGTAGHIDHGKSALVRALTGTDPDRLEEEKRRGITIDLGFATLDLKGPGKDQNEDQKEEQYRLGFVDVPGHERFVKNMLAGVGGIDLLLLIIAADEGIQPQTQEHFDICRLLEIQRGLVVLTKSDLVDTDRLDLAKLEVEEFLAGSFLANAPVVPVSAKTGAGLDQLRVELARAAGEAPAKDSSRHFRLPIDRSFLMKGFGTVITGTLVSGKVKKDTEVEVQPTGKRLRVRGIQVHGRAEDTALAGQRTALNLGGAEPGELLRGMTLTEPGRFQPTRRADCILNLLPSAIALKNGAQVHFHSATSEIIATAVILEEAPSSGDDTALRLDPGRSGYVQFRLREPLLLLPGDHFIIRKLSPVITIGGGRVLDNLTPPDSVPTRQKRDAAYRNFLSVIEQGSHQEILALLVARTPSRSITLVAAVARTGWLDKEASVAAEALCSAGKLVKLAQQSTQQPIRYADAAYLAGLQEAVLQLLLKFHQANPLQPGMSIEAVRGKVFRRADSQIAETVLRRMADAGTLVISGETARLAAHKIVLKDDEEKSKRQISKAFEAAGLSVPSIREVLDRVPLDRQRTDRVFKLLLQEKVLIRVSEDLVYHASALQDLRQRLAQHKLKSPRINVTAFKDLAGVSRKYAIPLLEYLDREKATRRDGDERVIL